MSAAPRRIKIVVSDFHMGSGRRLPDGTINEGWGLHLLDMHAPMGNLLRIAQAQSDAWVAAHSE